ncbi:deoxynucleoside kinase [Candidatus Woesearchaeota archaeon]|nr:deoxynucleoside kinase [Candidatus Woesearchaeota archaeon]
MENLRIGIVGNIGVGKSTLVNACKCPPCSDMLLAQLPKLSGEMAVHTFKEEFCPEVLDAFYKDPVRNALMAQLEFFNGRLDRYRKVDQMKGIVLEDRTLAEDYHIFGKAQRILGNMTEAEFLAYQRTFRLMSLKVPEPHLYVYLKADVDTLLQRIKQRGRDSEQGIPSDYLETLNQLYEDFISNHVNSPVLVIDATDDLELDVYLQKTVQRIADKIRTLNLRVTTPKLSEWVTEPVPIATLKAIDAEQALQDYLAKNPRLITVAGNIGLGKSTLASLLSSGLKINAIYERPEDNPLLKDFLKDKKRFCYQLQMHFLRARARMRRSAKESGQSHVKDRSLPEDLLIFSRAFRDQGILTHDEFDRLTTEFQRTNRELPQSDILIVIQGSPHNAWKRIQQRGREMEVDGGWEFNDIVTFDRLYRSYPQTVRQLGFHKGPIIEINTDYIDMTNHIHMGYICEQVLEKLKEGEKDLQKGRVLGKSPIISTTG